MSSIGGQQEIITVPDVTDRIDTPKGKVNETRKRAHYMDVSPLPMARAPHVLVDHNLSTPPASGSLYNSAFSPGAQKVESYMDHARTNAERPGTTLRQVLEVTLSEVQETQAQTCLQASFSYPCRC